MSNIFSIGMSCWWKSYQDARERVREGVRKKTGNKTFRTIVLVMMKMILKEQIIFLLFEWLLFSLFCDLISYRYTFIVYYILFDIYIFDVVFLLFSSLFFFKFFCVTENSRDRVVGAFFYNPTRSNSCFDGDGLSISLSLSLIDVEIKSQKERSLNHLISCVWKFT